MERHLLQAKAKALAEDERHLVTLPRPTTTNQKQQKGEEEGGVLLPSGPSQFRKQLNEELLARHSLLTPTQYLPQPLAPREAPKGKVVSGVCTYNSSGCRYCMYTYVSEGCLVLAWLSDSVNQKKEDGGRDKEMGEEGGERERERERERLT